MLTRQNTQFTEQPTCDRTHWDIEESSLCLITYTYALPIYHGSDSQSWIHLTSLNNTACIGLRRYLHIHTVCAFTNQTLTNVHSCNNACMVKSASISLSGIVRIKLYRGKSTFLRNSSRKNLPSPSFFLLLNKKRRLSQDNIYLQTLNESFLWWSLLLQKWPTPLELLLLLQEVRCFVSCVEVQTLIFKS